MNRDDIIRMAREVQLINEQGDCMYGDATEQMLAFAALIAEDCVKRCEAVRTHHEAERSTAWSELTRGVEFGAEECAAAIREAYKP